MRPKKIILCVDPNEQQLSELKFMLTINGYRVLAASDERQAVAMFSGGVDIVLAVDCEIVERLKRMRNYTPMILMGDKLPPLHSADSFVNRKIFTTSELLERIKVMAARKRGPRKGSPRTHRCAEAARISRAAA
jgi:DNA-binding response OmpR family regulator